MQAATRSMLGLCFWKRILWMASNSQESQVAVVSSLDIFEGFQAKNWLEFDPILDFILSYIGYLLI